MLKIKLTTLLLFVYSFSNAQILSYYINDGSSINQFITNDLNKKYLGTYLYKNTLLQRAYFIGRLDCQSNEKPDNIYNRVVNNPF